MEHDHAATRKLLEARPLKPQHGPRATPASTPARDAWATDEASPPLWKRSMRELVAISLGLGTALLADQLGWNLL